MRADSWRCYVLEQFPYFLLLAPLVGTHHSRWRSIHPGQQCPRRTAAVVCVRCHLTSTPQLSQRPISVGSPQHSGLVSSVEQPKPAVSEAPLLVHTPLSGPQVSRTISQEAANLGALLRSRHPGPQPPERRESMLPRPSSTPSQHSLERDANRSSGSPQFRQNPTDRPDMLDSGAEDDGSGSPQSGHSSQRALHPLAEFM
ncbi:hypothetical protein FGIG_11541 [Fasciola gigantica]|uniref:Uncharacterized protein n=1 Tax=Fasciola gigantica TaxID=46835 RepID=A0A504YZM8_FASGI|nr:hypothetical protein FGIG_11541 [Fasciola gigantica]